MTETTNTYSVESFIQNYFALMDEDPVQTDAGNIQPSLLSPGFAQIRPTPSPCVLPYQFFSAVNKEFRKQGNNLVVFPTGMFDTQDICVMEKELFVSLVEGKQEDLEANLPVEHANKTVLNLVYSETISDDAGGRQ